MNVYDLKKKQDKTTRCIGIYVNVKKNRKLHYYVVKHVLS